ncbi:hypothetical protein [Citrobacter amalonaticus]|uniref:Uncharacterized protein n=1 Tax=Citrobacter amalonaticus TaxID=35703 RepID=A0AAX2BP21_CITAM|nr:hypothetical protein [Citrobacter amalonaticus]SBA20642.1 protein of unknown function [Citrobacter amalonaticus]
MIINTHQPQRPASHNSHEAFKERQAEQSRIASMQDLRMRVLATLAEIDETPAHIGDIQNAEASNEKLWRAIEKKRTRRTLVNHEQKDIGKHAHEEENSVTAILRSIADYRYHDGTPQIKYHGEQWASLDNEMAFLIPLLPAGTTSTEIRTSVKKICNMM